MSQLALKFHKIRYLSLLFLIILWGLGTLIICKVENKKGHIGEFNFLIECFEIKENVRLTRRRLIKVMLYAQDRLNEEEKQLYNSTIDEIIESLKSGSDANTRILLENRVDNDLRYIIDKKYAIRWSYLETFLSTNLFFVVSGALFVPATLLGKILAGIIIIINDLLFIFLAYKVIILLISGIQKLFNHIIPYNKDIASLIRSIGNYIQQYQLDSLGNLFIILLVLWQIGALSLWLFERNVTFTNITGTNIKDFSEALWSISVYLLSGYEEYIPHSGTAKIISVVIILIGVSVISIFTANIVAIITKRMEEKDFFPTKPLTVDFQGHILICGVSDKTDRIIRQLHSDVIIKGEKAKPIVILGESVEQLINTKEKVYEQVWIVKGSPLNDEDLLKADVDNASEVIILSDIYNLESTSLQNEDIIVSDKTVSGISNLDKILDARTILCALAIDAIMHKKNKTVHICIELRDNDNKIHFERIHQDKEIISSKEFSRRLLVQSAVTFGLSYVYVEELLNATEDTTEVYRIPIPDDFIGKSYWQLEKILIENYSSKHYTEADLSSKIDIVSYNIILLGFITKGYKIKEGKKGKKLSKELFEEFIITNPQNPLNKFANEDYSPPTIIQERKDNEIDNICSSEGISPVSPIFSDFNSGNVKYKKVKLDKKYCFLKDDYILVISYDPPDFSKLKNNTQIIKNIAIPDKFCDKEINILERELYNHYLTLIDIDFKDESSDTSTSYFHKGDKISIIAYDNKDKNLSLDYLIPAEPISYLLPSFWNDKKLQIDEFRQFFIETMKSSKAEANIILLEVEHNGESFFNEQEILKANDKLTFYAYKEDDIETLLNILKKNYKGQKHLPIKNPENIKENKYNDDEIDILGIKDHIVICNWNEQGAEIIKHLTEAEQLNARQKRIITIILSDKQILPKEIQEKYKNVIIVLGQASDYDTLKRAGVQYSNSVIILSAGGDEELADTNSILTALAIENINPDIHTCVELKKSKNKQHFGRTKVDEIVCVDELTEKLLSQACLNHGLSKFFLDLLTATSDTNEIYRLYVPQAFIGQPYNLLQHRFFNYYQENIILIGIETHYTDENGNHTIRTILPENIQPKREYKKGIKGLFSKFKKADKEIVEDKDISHYGRSSAEYILKATDRLYVIAYHKPFIENIIP